MVKIVPVVLEKRKKTDRRTDDGQPAIRKIHWSFQQFPLILFGSNHDLGSHLNKVNPFIISKIKFFENRRLTQVLPKEKN